MIKKYFKEEKAQKGEVINTQSGHQIRASVKISLVMLDPVFFFFFFFFLIKPSVLPVIKELFRLCLKKMFILFVFWSSSHLY